MRAFESERQIRQFRADIRTWEDYIRRGREAMRLFECAFEFRYEDLLRSPRETLELASRKLALDLDTVGLCDDFGVNLSRIGTFKKSEWFNRIEVDSPLLQELGYDADLRSNLLSAGCFDEQVGEEC